MHNFRLILGKSIQSSWGIFEDPSCGYFLTPESLKFVWRWLPGKPTRSEELQDTSQTSRATRQSAEITLKLSSRMGQKLVGPLSQFSAVWMLALENDHGLVSSILEALASLAASRSKEYEGFSINCEKVLWISDLTWREEGDRPSVGISDSGSTYGTYVGEKAIASSSAGNSQVDRVQVWSLAHLCSAQLPTLLVRDIRYVKSCVFSHQVLRQLLLKDFRDIRA